MSLKQLPEASRPREKLLSHGSDALTDAELLAIFLRTGTQGMNALELATHLLDEFGSLRSLLGAEKQIFCQMKGLGPAKFALLQAVLALGERYLEETLKKMMCSLVRKIPVDIWRKNCEINTEKPFISCF